MPATRAAAEEADASISLANRALYRLATRVSSAALADGAGRRYHTADGCLNASG